MIKKIIFITVGFFAAQRLCHHATDGFALPKIKSKIDYHAEWEIPALSHEEELRVKQILRQPYRYLGRGAQAYVFASGDGQTVIKFFRHHRMRTLLCHAGCILPEKWRNRLQETIDKRRNKMIKDFHSYKLAYESLKEETGLLYIHLNKSSDLHIELPLYDKIGVLHHLDLDQMEFVVQKRAELIYPSLEKWIQDNQIDQGKKSLTELVQLLKRRCVKGFFDKDPDLSTNFGFIQGHPIQIDIGRFKEDALRCDPNVYADEIVRITDQLSQWLAKRSPELSQHLQSEVEALRDIP